MDYITRRLGRDVRLDDIMRMNGNHIGSLIQLYGFKTQPQVNAKKRERALQVLECMQAQPDRMFELPTWEDIPLGTVFVATDFDPVADADHIFARVIEKVGTTASELRLAGVLTDFSAGCRVLPQTDRDILANCGYEECTQARPSDNRVVGVTWRVGLVVDKNKGGFAWEWKPLKDKERYPRWDFFTTTPVVYTPGPLGPSYTVHRRHTVYQSAVHPWLGTFGPRMHVLMVTRAQEGMRRVAACARKHFKAIQARYTSDCPPSTYPHGTHGLAKVLSIVHSFTEGLPPSARRALMCTNTEFRDLLTPLDQQRKQTLCDISSKMFEKDPAIEGCFKTRSPRQLFDDHFKRMITQAKQEFANEPTANKRFVFNMMPYWTPYRFVLTLGVGADRVTEFERGMLMVENPGEATYITLGITHMATANSDAEVFRLMIKEATTHQGVILRRYILDGTATTPYKDYSLLQTDYVTKMPAFFEYYLAWVYLRFI